MSDRDSCVMPRNCGAVDDQRTIPVPSGNVLAVVERQRLLHPEHLDRCRRGPRRGQASHIGAERISSLVSGSNDAGIARRITEHGSKLRDQTGQAGARDVHVWPE